MANKKKEQIVIIPLSNKGELADAIQSYGVKQREKNRIVSQYNDKMSELQTKLREETKILDEDCYLLGVRIKHFCDENRKSLFESGSKTQKLTTGSVSYRDIPAFVKTKLTSTLLEKILTSSTLEKHYKKFIERCGKVFLRVKIELDKDGILSDPVRAKKEFGIEVEAKRERFYIKPTELDAEVEVDAA
ncbi:host-nuclease inhibitor Gam family protein [Leptospira interrogans]|uniref:host-nuclease inhibitor Gam family protein n=1 Tax=Leptospira interrogans TaxID=173 RepID=UPI0002BB5054|nr:host-nuclease inhibitor Gam family protein [Leptospira interrogans]MCR8647669.1 Gam-like protein [Leptospira interrogans serovar Bataviae]OAM85436.1 Gam-like protein [Leptospira interrogans serovar Bataviae]QOI33591.1 Gam-like protein [Leptospira interrogans serovar Icterohaemorrhagiae]QOI36885.1 Gam-like protein [Leptospira interrogans serovar Bataviae]QOI38375.1 Gam-like protein [Leptospira interrogans serovar Bataviae]